MKMGSFDFKEWEDFAKNFDKQTQAIVKGQFIEQLANEMGTIMWREIRESTPVGQYSNHVSFTTSDGKLVEFTASNTRVGGNLRSKWQMKKAVKVGSSWVFEVFNNEFYGPYVEKGHRIVREGVTIGWVEGQFFVKFTMEALADSLPAVAEEKFIRMIEGLFN